jgi:multidrug efflux pump subunit AcrA (membrane-fusion protein)
VRLSDALSLPHRPRPRRGGAGRESAGLFRGINGPFRATRYHSLVVDRATMPASLAVTAETADRLVMGLAHATLPVMVSAPGHTAALMQQKLRAPFAGTLTELRVVDGDPVSRGQSLGTIVARESEAALSGAREMLRQAATPGEKSNASERSPLRKRTSSAGT